MKNFYHAIQLCFMSVYSIAFICAHSAYAQNTTRDFEKTVRQSLEAYQAGDYAQALRVMNTAPSEMQNDIKFLYWSGTYHFKLQNLKQAIEFYQRVIDVDQGRTFPGVWYQMGQCLYATQDFSRARQSFIQSASRGYKRGASEYYVGYTSQILGDYTEALQRYRTVQSLPAAEWEIKQPAAFESAEIYFLRAKKMTSDADKQKALRNIVIPAFEWARDLDKKNPLSAQASLRIDEVKRQLGLLVPRTRNKSLIPVKPWVIRFSQNAKYDSNVINEPDNRIIKVTNRESPLSHSALFGKYEAIFWNWIVATPELGADATFSLNRGNREIYSNDNMSINPALRFRLDHEIKKRPAAGLIEYEYSWNSRDYLGDKTQLYYNRYNNFILGERFNIFDLGPTTLKANLKLAEFSNTRLSYIGPGVSLSQTWIMFRRYALNTAVNFENQWTNDRLYAQRNYRANLSYSMPALFWNTSVDLGFNFGLIDTVNQQESRGWEKNYNPTLGFSKLLDEASHWIATLNYSYSQNVSRDDEAYSYVKHVGSLGIQYTF